MSLPTLSMVHILKCVTSFIWRKMVILPIWVHPKEVYKVTLKKMKAVKQVYLDEPYCTGTKNMGYDLMEGCSIFVDK